MLKDLVLKCRSYRRFYQDVAIDNGTLRELVDLARYSASAINRQPLKYILSSSPEKNALIFSTSALGRTLKTWPGPDEGERPAGYIIILGDKEISANFGWTMELPRRRFFWEQWRRDWAAACWEQWKGKLRQLLNIPGRYEILLVVALGKPKEKIILETMKSTDSYDYWRDKDEGHHVPKRKLNDIIVAEL